MATIALADDHILLRNGLASMLSNIGYEVLFEADNGKDLIQKLSAVSLPDIVLMDINMPEMDGYQTTLWLKQQHPSVMVLALSMYDNQNAVIRMLKCGARGYILKDSEPAELKEAILSLLEKGFYYSDLVTGSLFNVISQQEKKDIIAKENTHLNQKEIEFLQLICSELTYKEIADKMKLKTRTVESYRDELFKKLNAKTRVGLVKYAIKNKIVDLE